MNDNIYTELFEKIIEKLFSLSDNIPSESIKSTYLNRFINVCNGSRGSKSLVRAQLKKIYNLIVGNELFNSYSKMTVLDNIISILEEFVKVTNSSDIEKYNIKVKLLNDFNDISDVDAYTDEVKDMIDNNPEGLDELTFLYEDSFYKIYLADDEKLFRKVFYKETNWCVVNESGYWGDYTNKGILVLFEDLNIRYRNKNLTSNKFILGTLTELKNGDNSFIIAMDMMDKRVSTEIKMKVESYKDIIVKSIKKIYGNTDTKGNEKTVYGLTKEIYTGKYATQIRITDDLTIPEDIFGMLSYDGKNTLEFLDEEVTITDIGNAGNYLDLLISEREIDIKTFVFRGNTTLHRIEGKTYFPTLKFDDGYKLTVNDCHRLELDIDNDSDYFDIDVVDSTNITISPEDNNKKTINKISIIDSDNISSWIEVDTATMVEGCVEVNFSAGIYEIEEINDVRTLYVNNRVTEVEIKKIGHEGLNSLYLSNDKNFIIDDREREKINDIFIDDNETNESVDNRFIRQENKEYSIVNEMLKKGFSCLSKNKKV